MSKHATCGRSGLRVIAVRIGARLCGSCRGASGTSASSSASNSGVTRAGLEWRSPPCTTRWPRAARRRAPRRSLAQGIIAGRSSLGVEGGAAPRSGGTIASPSGPVALAEGRDPETIHLTGQEPSLAFVEAEFERGGAGVDHADQGLSSRRHAAALRLGIFPDSREKFVPASEIRLIFIKTTVFVNGLRARSNLPGSGILGVWQGIGSGNPPSLSRQH